MVTCAPRSFTSTASMNGTGWTRLQRPVLPLAHLLEHRVVLRDLLRG